MSENMVRPRKKFDREYATEWRKERDWLAGHGFEPTFVKRVGDGIERYKYRKTSELFENLALFYRTQESEREWLRMQAEIAERGTKLDVDCFGFSAGEIAEAIDAADHDDYNAAVKEDVWEDDTL